MMKLLFRKTIKFNQKEPESNSKSTTWKERCRKWDRSIASMFGLLAFFTLVGIVIYNIFSEKCSSCDDDCNDSSKTNRKTQIEEKCTVEKCKIECKDIIEGNYTAEDYVSDALSNILCDDIELLTISACTFQNGEINNGWLKTIKPDVRALAIKKGNLKEINKDALAGQPFNNLNRLEIIDSKIEVLRKHSLLKLNTLNEFYLKNYKSPRKLDIEERALDGVSSSLTNLDLEGFILKDPRSILNLIGETGAMLTRLEVVAIQRSTLKKLLPNSFSHAANIKSLYLSDNGLEAIDRETFSRANKIELLHLNNNLLTTLSNGTFSNMLHMKTGQLHLSENQWECECSLKWLQDYYIEYNAVNTTTPPTCNGIKFEDYDFCPTIISSSSPDTTTSPTTTSSLTTPSPTTTPSLTTPSPTTTSFPTTISTLSSITTPTSSSTTSGVECTQIVADSGAVNVTCTRPVPAHPDAVVESKHRAQIIVEDETVDLEFLELEGDPLQVKVTVVAARKNLDSHHLLWFNSDNKSETGCQTSFENNTILSLNRGTTYTFSVLYDCKSETSPKCTFGFKTLPDWALRTWISNQYQGAVIGLSVLLTLIIICLATLGTFLCIRRHPKLISSNKSVIIVKPGKKSEEDAPPREYERPAYWEPYLVPSSQGYLTPKYHRYSRVKYRPPLMRSISEWSVSSNPSIYANPTPKQLREWKATLSNRQNQKNQTTDVYEYDYKPPLPPPNPQPSIAREREIPEDVFYTCA